MMRLNWSTARGAILAIYVLAVLVFVYLPTLVIPVFALNDSVHVALPLKGFTTRWFEALANDSQMQEALKNSFRVAVPVSLVSTVMGTAAAKAVTRYNIPGKVGIMGFLMLPMAIPSLLIALALLMLVRFTGVPLSILTAFFGHLLVCLPLSIVIMIAQIDGFDKSLEEAARDLGETRFGTFRRVTLPLILPGMIASLFLTFTVSFDEFMLSNFLSGTNMTLPVYIWSQLRFPEKLPTVMALATIILVLTFTLAGLAEWLRRSVNRRNLRENRSISQ